MLRNWISTTLYPWAMDHGVTILLIAIAIVVINHFSEKIITSVVRKAVPSGAFLTPQAERKREDTLIRIFKTTINILVVAIGMFMIISELGVNIAPLLAGAGLVGVAVGFGAQYLVRDIISGLFIILENQYRVGDVVNLLDTSGTVEDITLRKTVLRDLDGTVHHIPNGEVKKASNLSKDFARINLNIGVAYESDIEKVEKVINKVGEELANDPVWSEYLKTTPQFVRIDSFGASSVDVKIIGEVEPLQQWAVAGELRKRLKIAFDKAKIDIPYPQRVVRQVKK